MKLFVRLLLLISLSVLAAACADGNALEWTTDKDTSEARRDEIDFAFIEGNCGFVIQMLSPHEGYLSGFELYQYDNAILACSGFSLVNSISVILGEDGGDDPFVIIQNLMGTDILTADKISELKDSYGKILNSCTGVLDDDMKTVCGMTAAADAVLAVSGVALTLSGSESIKATKEGLTEAVNGKTAAEITAAVESSVNDGVLDMDRLDNDLNTVLDASSVIAEMAESDIDFSEDLAKFAGDIKDPVSDTVTVSSFSDYIYYEFAGGAM